ncbi:Di-trans-poly-cis-decaprenylcistransferase-like protein [Pseudohyphozyma bogoriensis]|nr:Di-trans-poly-cis-decaprenylcistransferase-like protein [Pseudohyphozyma bogoriensis]
MGRIVDLLLLPLQLAVLVILHICQALARLFYVLSLLPLFASRQSFLLPPSLFAPPPAPSPTHSIERDKARWTKTPKHLAVVFVPALTLGTWTRAWSFKGLVEGRKRRKRRKEEEELQKLVKDLGELIRWCEKLEIRSLSVYDERGILDRNAEAVKASLSSQVPILPTSSDKARTTDGHSSFLVAVPKLTLLKDEIELAGREVDSGCDVSDTCDLATTSNPSVPSSTPTLVSPYPADLHPITPSSRQAHLRVNLLSRLAGRPQLAKIAQSLCGRSEKEGGNEKLEVGVVEETLSASTIAEPDLLLVLGGPYLRLRGFPPWQLRLTEMYHHASPAWLPAPVLTYSILRHALDVYGGAEMRLGR